MEELLKQILENQLSISDKFIEIKSNQENIIKEMKKIEEREEIIEKEINNLKKDNNYKKLEEQIKKFKEDATTHFIKLEKELQANLDDIAYIFKQYDSKPSKLS